MNVIRRRMKRCVAVTFKDPEQQTVFVVVDVIELADALKSVLRLGDGVADKALRIRQRGERKQLQRRG